MTRRFWRGNDRSRGDEAQGTALAQIQQGRRPEAVEIRGEEARDLVLVEAPLEGLVLMGCRFERCVLLRCLLENTTFVDCEFVNCHLESLNLLPATFTDCLFDRSSFVGCSFEGARLEGALARRCKFSGPGHETLLTGLRTLRCEHDVALEPVSPEAARPGGADGWVQPGCEDEG